MPTPPRRTVLRETPKGCHAKLNRGDQIGIDSLLPLDHQSHIEIGLALAQQRLSKPPVGPNHCADPDSQRDHPLQP